jgi:hypothetical protein
VEIGMGVKSLFWLRFYMKDDFGQLIIQTIKPIRCQLPKWEEEKDEKERRLVF